MLVEPSDVIKDGKVLVLGFYVIMQLYVHVFLHTHTGK